MKSGTVNVSFACSETINLADIRTADGAEGSEGELEVTGDLELTANNNPLPALRPSIWLTSVQPMVPKAVKVNWK